MTRHARDVQVGRLVFQPACLACDVQRARYMRMHRATSPAARHLPATSGETAKESRIVGALLGTAAGDSIGLPFEGLSRARVRAKLGEGPVGHSLCFRRGMLSDDTEHACLVAEALIETGDEPERFARVLARKLRHWLAALPPATGFATLRGILKLWLGFPPESSGVRSAGNGACMRAPMIGVWAADDHALRRALVRASTRITHRDSRAEQGALVIARMAGLAADASPAHWLAEALAEVEDDSLGRALEAACSDAPLDEVARQLGVQRGVSGFVLHTVPMAVAVRVRNPHAFRAAVEAAVRLGGDTDTTAAIVGALSGAALGPEAIPESWLAGIVDHPRSVAHLQQLAGALARGTQFDAPFWPLCLVRNLAFGSVVVSLALRRLALLVR